MAETPMTPKEQIAWDGLRGQRGRIVGDHPWAGHHGEIVRLERTLVGWGLVVKLDDGSDVPPGQECFVFDPRYWRKD